MVRDAQVRFGGDSVARDKIVFYLTGGQMSSPLRPLSPSLEEFARHAFETPDKWDEYRRDFRDRRTVLLRGTPGNGRATMAIRLLQTVETKLIYELSPKIDLSRMAGQLSLQPIEPNTAFLLCQPEDIAQLDAYAFHSLEDALTRADARLVVTVGPESVFRDDGLLRYQMTLPAAPAWRDILLRHLGHRLDDDEARAEAILGLPEIAELVTETLDSPGMTCELTAELAMLLSQPGERLDATWIRGQLTRRQIDEFDMWFDGLADLELRCLAIALAVLDGLPIEEVAEAARRLYKRLSAGGPLTLADDSTLAVTDFDPFRAHPARVLRMLRAGTRPTEVLTEYGHAPATAMFYRDPTYAKRVIERTWHGYRIHDELLDWLGELVETPFEEVRVYAGTTIGAVTTLGFEYVRRRILHDWATSDGIWQREAVADALEVVAEEEPLKQAVTWFVDMLNRSESVPARCTAALAHGTGLGRPEPTASIQSLERLARTDDFDVQVSIGKGFVYLLLEDIDARTPLFYGAIERCLSDPKRAGTAELIFLRVAYDVITDVRGPDDTVTRWPTLLRLAHENDHLRRPLFQLWARTLAGGGHVPTAEAVLRVWAGYAEADPANRDAFARLARAVAAIDPLAGLAFERLSRWWNSEEQMSPMPNVALAVGGVLTPGPVER